MKPIEINEYQYCNELREFAYYVASFYATDYHLTEKGVLEGEDKSKTWAELAKNAKFSDPNALFNEKSVQALIEKGSKAIYPLFYDNQGLTTQDVFDQLPNFLLWMQHHNRTWAGGDSFDREAFGREYLSALGFVEAV